MVTKPKDTWHKIYINIKVYQTNFPPKLVTSKTFFPLTWSSPPKSITPPEEWHLILKFLPLFDIIVKGHKKPKEFTGDRQKTDIEGTRRTRNYRPTRKRKTRCYGHKDKRNMQTMWKTMHTGGSRWIERCQAALEQTLMDRTTIKKLSITYRDLQIALFLSNSWVIFMSSI